MTGVMPASNDEVRRPTYQLGAIENASVLPCCSSVIRIAVSVPPLVAKKEWTRNLCLVSMD